MSNDELRRMFDTVLTAPPPDTGDIDAAIRSGRGRRRRRTAAVLLSAAAVIAAIGVTTTVLLPDGNRHPALPAASSTATNDEGTTVTSAHELLGSWWGDRTRRAERTRRPRQQRPALGGDVRAERGSAAVGSQRHRQPSQRHLQRVGAGAVSGDPIRGAANWRALRTASCSSSRIPMWRCSTR